MDKFGFAFVQAARMSRMNDGPIHSPGCVKEMQQLMEFLKKRYPHQRANFEAIEFQDDECGADRYVTAPY